MRTPCSYLVGQTWGIYELGLYLSLIYKLMICPWTVAYDMMCYSWLLTIGYFLSLTLYRLTGSQCTQGLSFFYQNILIYYRRQIVLNCACYVLVTFPFSFLILAFILVGFSFVCCYQPSIHNSLFFPFSGHC
jgi:hypothetical protein